MTESLQALREFTQNILSDLESGAISVHEAYAAASQYAYLRQELSSASLTLSEAATVSDEELTHVFAGVISQTLTRLSELPSFQSQQPDTPETEQEIRDVAFLQQAATNRVREQIRTPSVKEKRRTFVHELVTKFSSTVPVADAQMEGFVDKATAIGSRESTPKQRAERFSHSLTESIEGASGNMSTEQKRVIELGVLTTTTEQGEFLADQFTQAHRETEIYSALFNTPDIKRPDVFVDIMLNAPPSEPVGETLTRADKLARVAQSLEESSGKQGGKLQFFSANGARGVAGGLQKGADGILSLVGEPVRDMVLHEKVNGSLRSMLSNTQQFADRLGENFVRSALFTHINQDLTKQLSDKTRGGQAGSMFGDVFSTVFRGPLGQPLTRSANEGILDYFELARANAAAPKGKAFLAPGVLPWDIFRVSNTRRSDTDALSSSSNGRGIFPLLGLRAGNATSSIGSFFGTMASSLIDKATAFTLLSPRLPGQLSASRRAAAIPTPIADDMPLMVALIVVIVVVFLFVLPTPLNLNMINHSAKVSSLFAALKNTAKVVFTGELICTGDCRWPTVGTITQGPNTGASHKGGIAESIDIGAPCGTPVLSTVNNAEIISVSNTCTDNTGFPGSDCGGGWGNYIIIKGEIQSSTNQPTTVTLRYSHLMQDSMLDLSTPIAVGTKIGRVDQNGSSDGCHLHYEVFGNQPPINTILPTIVPSCIGRTACCLQMGSSCVVTP